MQVPLQKAVDSKDCSYDRWGIAPRCSCDEAECVDCNVLHGRSLEFVTPTAIKNFFVKSGFSNDCVISNDEDKY
jgi:hypothetical protein